MARGNSNRGGVRNVRGGAPAGQRRLLRGTSRQKARNATKRSAGTSGG